jgi:putative heme-binding domain-containing protein
LTDEDFSNRDLANGKRMFAAAACYKCHRVAGQGGSVGPDLTPAGHRFSTYDLLETIVNPSKAISDQYEATIFLLIDGRTITGRVANLKGNQYRIQEDMISPSKLTTIDVDDIDEMKPSKLSMMPNGLLDNLTREEILDLVAYMKSTAPAELSSFGSNAN